MRPSAHFLLWLAGLARAQTQTTEAERKCLAKHAAGRRYLVEIGSWHGVTTRRLRESMPTEGLLYAIDPYPVGRLGLSLQQLIAHREVRRSDNGKVRWLRTTGVEAGRAHARMNLPLVDFIFIDGDHTYEGLRGDWETWSPLVAPEGIVALHDSRPTPNRRIESAGSVVYTESVIVRDRSFEVVETVDSLTVLRRRGAAASTLTTQSRAAS